MKRFFALVLALIVVLSLAACGEEKRVSKKDKKYKNTEITTASTDPIASQDVQDITDAPINQTGDTIFSTSDYALTVTDVNFDDSYYGIEINVKAENKSADEEYTIMLESFIVNGIQADGTCYIDIGAGEVKNEHATVSRDYLEMAGIDTVEGFEATFYIINGDYDTLDTQTFTYGETTQYTRASQSTDQVLVDTADAKVTLVEKGWGEYTGYDLIMYIENFTSDELYLNVENVTINGTEYDAYLGASVIPNCSAFNSTSFYSFDLEEMGITSEADIKEIKFELIVTNWDTFDELSSTPVTIKP